MHLSLRASLILVTLLFSSLAINASASNSFALKCHHESASHHGPNSRSLLRRLRDGIIESIWSIPARTSSRTSCDDGSQNTPDKYSMRYGSDVVLRFKVNNVAEAKELSEASKILFLDVWDTSENWVDIRIAKDMVESFLGLLSTPSLRTSYTPLILDLAQAVAENYPSTYKAEPVLARDATVPYRPSMNLEVTADPFFRDYQPLSVITPWMKLLASMFPAHVNFTTIGKSAQGRDIPAIRVGAQPEVSDRDDHESRQTILITGGSHAREWISVTTVNYIAHTLITRYGNPRFPYVTKLLDHFDLVFIPTLNPDGYEHTWTTDRLWRKTLQPTYLSFCPGIDLDRAFGYGWDGDKGSDSPCSEDYAGQVPFAAVEAQQFRDWLKNQTADDKVSFAAYIDFHSYSQEVLYPYSYSCEAEPYNLEDLEEVAIGIAKSFRLTNGHYYQVNSACEGSVTFSESAKETSAKKPKALMINAQGGSALDYLYHDIGVRYSFQVKLRDTGSYGFLLPRYNIVPTGSEAYEATLGMGRWLLGNHGIELTDEEKAQGAEEVADTKTVMKEEDDEYYIAITDQDDAESQDANLELRRRRRRR